MSTGWILAHQGGWDEILMVLTPISLFAGLLWLANRRANAQIQAGAESSTPAEPAAGAPAGDEPSDRGEGR